MAKEEIVLDLNVDQGSMISELERTKKSIIQLREEQQKLTKAYKDGEVTVEEYASESVRLEAILKKEQATYTNTQKAVTGVKTKMDELIKSNNNLAQSVKTSTENIRVAGVSVGDLTTKISSLANPVTAAVGVVTALGAAYARSTIGAKDLEFASNQLSFTIDALTDAFARNFSSVEDGEGAVTRLFNRYLKFNENMPTGKFLKLLGVDLKEIREQSFNAAQAMEKLQNVREAAALGQATINERNAETADLMADVANTELDIVKRLEAAEKIRENIKLNAKELVAFKNQELLAELDILKVRKESGGDTGDIEFRLNKLVAERAAIEVSSERQNTKIEKQINSINNAESKRLELLKKQREETERKIQAQEEAERRARETPDLTSFGGESGGDSLDPQEQFEKDFELINQELELTLTAEEEKRNAKLQTNAVEEQNARARTERHQKEMAEMQENFMALANLFSQGSAARKFFALAAIGVDTAQAIASLTAASEANPANAITFGGAGAAQFAAGLIRIFANIAAAKQFLDGGSFAEGGYTGHGGKYQAAGVVHKGEVVWSQADVAAAGGPSRVDRMRPTYPRRGSYSYADGGVVTAVSNNMNQQLATSNALKNMPIPEVSVVEVTKTQKRVAARERISR